VRAPRPPSGAPLTLPARTPHPARASCCRAEYQRNKEAVVAMLLQVVMNIENPFKQ
jgi:hypothetical protein